MLISRNWLQSYFTTELPSAHDIAETLLVHSFEIEDVYQTPSGDWVIDVDVLPNRAHDCLCHLGIAVEYDGLTDYVVDHAHHRSNYDGNPVLDTNLSAPSVTVTGSSCRRYHAFVVEDISVGDSPLWLQNYLNAIGARVINNVVDITNYLMFDLGQPMHAFDADKVVGSIQVRNAQEGESFTSLNGEEVSLYSHDLVIADDEGILALAGVKGGMKAEVTKDTKRIIVELANFRPDTTRLTARRVKILTDSSKRFENELHPGLIDEVATAARELFATIAGVHVGESFDYYPEPVELSPIVLPIEHLNRVLGTTLEVADVARLLNQFAFDYVVLDEVFTVTVPYRRLDLQIPEDLIEELGRWYGYHNIPSKPIIEVAGDSLVNPVIYVVNLLRNHLISYGYRELYTYSFVPSGEVEVSNPIASDKPALRTNLLTPGNEQALELNLKNAGFLGLDRIQTFEFGRVYRDEKEYLELCVVCENVGKKAHKQFGEARLQLSVLETSLESLLGNLSYTKQVTDHSSSYTFDYQLPADESLLSYREIFDIVSHPETTRYHSLSVYPYSIRDISLWVDTGVTAQEVLERIVSSAGELLQRHYIFDEFTKDGRTSYAFSLVFQSHERTLTDVDIDTAMNAITQDLISRGWDVR